MCPPPFGPPNSCRTQARSSLPRVRDLGERRLLLALAGERGAGAGIIVDSGDDAAVLRPSPGHDLVATTDAFVEDVHYRAEWLDPHSLGARLAAANLSDLAAMAAIPRWALLSMGVREDRDADLLLEVQRGLAGALTAWGAAVVGGNLSRVDGPEWYDLTLLGEVEAGRVWTRRGARPGDLLAVTGHPGRAGAGLALATRLPEVARRDEGRPLLDAWLRPRPRVALARALAAVDCVRAAIDVSDGIRADLEPLCAAVGLVVEERLWPPDESLDAAARALGVDVAALRFGPSDDYELLLALDPARRGAAEERAREAGVPLAVIGAFTADRGQREWIAASGARTRIPGAGWDHFGGAART